MVRFCAACGLLALANAAAADLKSHWKFDEQGGTLAADSQGAYYGTLSGSAAFAPGQGVSGGAVSIASAGNGYVNMEDIYGAGNQSLTMALWVKMSRGDQAHSIIAGKHESTVVKGYFLAANAGAGYGTPNKAYFYMSNSPPAEPISQTSINDGQWHHIAASYEAGGQVRLYVDGAPVESVKPSVGIVATSVPFAVGAITFPGQGLKNVFNGMVDDLQVYDTALSCADIEYLYQHPGQPLGPHCFADCDASGTLDIDDFICFQIAYAFSDGRVADCDCSGGLDVDDFICFQTAFGSGCP